MNNSIQLFQVVALTEDLPQKNLFKGQVGTVVEILAPDAFEVDFSDEDGQTYAMTALQDTQLMALHY